MRSIHPRTQALLLRRRRAVVLPEGSGGAPVAQVSTLLHNISTLGFTATPALIDRMLAQSAPELAAFYEALVAALRAMVGAHRPWAPMYPDFPQQVMSAPEAELYLNAMVHYLGDWEGLRILPRYVTAPRPPLAGQAELKPIGVVEEGEALVIARRLIGSKTSLSPDDKEAVEHVLTHYGSALEQIIPADIPHKENLAHTAKVLLQTSTRADILLTRYFKTATDVLRLITALSDGDVSLAADSKFKRLKRGQRRMLLAMIERLGSPLEDMQRHRGRWLRVGERLHPGEHRSRYPQAAAAFDALRSGERAPTFNGRIEPALAAHDTDAVLAVARTRPGELARRLDHILRSTPAPEATLAAFADVATSVATPVLLQVLAHFRARPGSADDWRSFFPKGDAAKIYTTAKALPPLAPELCARVVASCRAALVQRFAERARLGKVWVDPRLSTQLVPFSQRSASKSLRSLVRGSRLPLPPGDTLRFFLWWREGEVNGQHTGRVDIDLSAVMYDDAWRYKEHVSYTRLRSGAYNCAHSGDITSAPHGACEFIDLDVPSVARYGGRWVVMNVNAFTEHPFCDLPECFAGWMARTEPGSGEIFEPSTVVDKVDLTAKSRMCIPVIIDVRERQLYWADLALRHHPRFVVALESNKVGFVHMGRAITTLRRATLHDLFTLHGEARGEVVADRGAADVVFSMHEGITPFDTDRIVADFL